MSTGWIGVDFDGTLAEYHGWNGELSFGAPLPAMVSRVKRWLAAGYDVRIFTARVSDNDPYRKAAAINGIRQWCLDHIGAELPITNVKDFSMIELWDDRAVHVIENTGEPLFPLITRIEVR